MNVIKNATDSYKKNPGKVILVSLLVLLGLIFYWYATVPLVLVIYLWKKFRKEEESKKGTKTKCPHCKTEIDWEASRCPNCHGKITVWTADKKIGATILVALVFVAIVQTNLFTSDSSTNTSSVSSQEQEVKDRKTISIVFAEQVIEGILKAPSTAKFVDVRAYELSNLKDVWAVNGYVDSQNSFGAMIRSQWEVQLDYRDGKGGTVKSVLFDGKKMQ